MIYANNGNNFKHLDSKYANRGIYFISLYQKCYAISVINFNACLKVDRIIALKTESPMCHKSCFIQMVCFMYSRL